MSRTSSQTEELTMGDYAPIIDHQNMLQGDYQCISRKRRFNQNQNPPSTEEEENESEEEEPAMSEYIENFKRFIHAAKFEEKAHQIDGMEWILNNELRKNAPCNIHGGLIADEMGLGKTIQMLGAIVCSPKPHTLIVLPLALLDQWKETIQQTMKHTPLIFHGPKKSAITIEQLGSNPVVLTTYGLMSTTKKGESKNILNQIHWDRIIFDEAHHLRNKNTRNHKGALKLRRDISWLVTGTPIQNRKEDFFNLCAVMGLPAGYYTNMENLKIWCETSS